MSLIVNIVGMYFFGVINNLAAERIYLMNVRIGEEVTMPFSYSMLLLLGPACISLINYYRKLNALNHKYSDEKTQNNGLDFNLEIFTLRDRVIICTYHCLYKYLPEYSIQITDYISKLVGKSCKSLSLVIIMFLHRTPVIGKYLNDMINESEGLKFSKNLGMSDWIKAILNCLSILLFAWKGYSWKSDKISFGVSVLGFFLVLLSLLFDSLKSLKLTILNKKFNKMNNPYYSEKLKLEYVKVFNLGLMLFTLAGCVYDSIFNNLLGFLYYNVYHINAQFIISYAIASLCGSTANYFYFTIIREQGPLTLAIVSSFRKVLTILSSIFVYSKSVDELKWIAILIVCSLITYEVKTKSKKGLGRKESD